MRSQIAGATREPGHGAIDGIEEHAKKDEGSGDGERAPAKGSCPRGFTHSGRVVNGAKAADKVAQSHERGQHLDSGDTAPVGAAAQSAPRGSQHAGFAARVDVVWGSAH